MPNTTLPTDITAGSPGIVSHANTLHTEMNRMSRSTGWAVIPLLNGWKVGSGGWARIRRDDFRTVLQVVGLDGTAATSNVFAKFSSTDDGSSLSVAFRGPGGTRSPMFWGGPATTGRQFFFSQPSDGNLWCSDPAAVNGVSGYEWGWHASNNGMPSFFTPA